ncbi:hypothetical protein LTR36_000189 [Oleoguttula mirabilis]|uniref:WD40 repeat-like protein n=1 Tax=Oleoguttula mirabilis TaxID=1507867 RepID=A0AAV9JYC9_9PEZI|nr:hypothetical protein LTR36_000189 [Oleoguttula mirabilis]
MSKSNDAGHFFQTSDALATIERKAAKAKNKHGDPIELPSKILAVRAIDDGSVYVAEAAGELKRVVLETSQVKRISSPAPAPLTSLAVSEATKTLYAGCWDKYIYSTPLSRSPSTVKQRLAGHTDFVKCLAATSLNGQPILLSGGGGADAVIIVWDLGTGKQLHKLRGHTKALQDFAIDPFSLPEGSAEPKDSFVLYTASSDPEIRCWHISWDSAYELPESLDKPILAHDTSVYRLRFDSEGDLWTASADKTVKHLVRSRDWEADTVLQHPDFVRDVVVAEQLGLVVTACRDEEVRVWDISSGDLVCTYSGHFEEVTGLALVGGGRKVVSVSIDATVRQWSLEKQEMARYLEELKREEDGDDVEEMVEKSEGGMLTAEEEAELAELMDDDDD